MAEDAKQLGNKAFTEKNYAAALQYYAEALKFGEDHTVYSNRSMTHAKLGDGRAALADATKCLEIKGDFAKVRPHLPASLRPRGPTRIRLRPPEAKNMLRRGGSGKDRPMSCSVSCGRYANYGWPGVSAASPQELPPRCRRWRLTGRAWTWIPTCCSSRKRTVRRMRRSEGFLAAPRPLPRPPPRPPSQHRARPRPPPRRPPGRSNKHVKSRPI
jgi:hypothetical protein